MTRKEIWLHTIRRRFFISIWPPWSGPMATTKMAPSRNGIPIRSRVGPKCCDARASNHPNKTTARSPLQRLFIIIFHWLLMNLFRLRSESLKEKIRTSKAKDCWNLLPLHNTILLQCRTLHRLHPISQFYNEVFDWKTPATKFCSLLHFKMVLKQRFSISRTWFYWSKGNL